MTALSVEVIERGCPREDWPEVEALYLESFPSHERVDPEQLVATLDTGERELFLVKDERAVRGFLITLRLLDGEIAMVEYVAVAHDARGDGIGAELFKTTYLHYRAQGILGLVGEAESRSAGGSDERELRTRRIAWWEGLSAALGGVRLIPEQIYRVPNLCGGGTVDMELGWLPLIDGMEPPKGAALEAIVRDIWRRCYDRDHGDPLLEEVVELARQIGTQ
jgi:GNAT superfamily N-acetyltransferase